MIVKIDGKSKWASDGTWFPVGRIEIQYFYLLYRKNVRKSRVSKNIKRCKRDLTFQKTRAFVLL